MNDISFEIASTIKDLEWGSRNKKIRNYVKFLCLTYFSSRATKMKISTDFKEWHRVTKYKIQVKTTSCLHSIKMVQSVNYALVLALVLVSFVWGQMRNNRQLDHFLPPPPARFNERQILRNRPRLDFEYESDSSSAADTDLISRWVTSSVNESLMMKISLLQKEWCKSTLTSSHQNILIK